MIPSEVVQNRDPAPFGSSLDQRTAALFHSPDVNGLDKRLRNVERINEFLANQTRDARILLESMAKRLKPIEEREARWKTLPSILPNL
jgi:hypothetical protein